MGVRKDREHSELAYFSQFVAFRQLTFCPEVFNLFAGFILGKSGDYCIPAVCFVQCYLCSVAQSEFQFSRSLSILIISIVPHFHDSCFCLFRCVAVCKSCDRSLYAGVGQRVAFRQSGLVFCPGVNDLDSRCILRKFINCCCPFIAFAQCYFGSVAQSDGQAFRSLAVLVVRIVPHLLDSCLCLFGCVAVRKSCNRSFLAVSGQCIAFRQAGLVFCPGVADFLTVCILRKSGNCCCPFVLFVQCYSFSVAQLDCQALRSDSVLVVRIVPHLLNRSFCRLRCVLVRNSCQLAFCCIADQFITGRD